MVHVVVDIETLGTWRSAAILSIGALNVEQLDAPHRGFSAVISVESNLAACRFVDGKTVAWHLDHHVDALAAARSTRYGEPAEMLSLGRALAGFAIWLKDQREADPDNRVRVWAKSPSFDLMILRHALNQGGIEPPWDYWEERDIRTLDILRGFETAREQIYAGGGSPPVHTADGDAIREAKLLSWALTREAG